MEFFSFNFQHFLQRSPSHCPSICWSMTSLFPRCFVNGWVVGGGVSLRCPLTSNSVEQKEPPKKEKHPKQSRPFERKEEEELGMVAYGPDSNRARALHVPLHSSLMKLMEIEPLKALSLLRSGGQSTPTQTKTKTVPTYLFAVYHC